jgi:hypothetical protein
MKKYRILEKSALCVPGRGRGERRGGRAASGGAAGGRGLAARTPVQVPPPDISDGLQFSTQLTLQQLLLPAPSSVFKV